MADEHLTGKKKIFLFICTIPAKVSRDNGRQPNGKRKKKDSCQRPRSRGVRKDVHTAEGRDGFFDIQAMLLTIRYSFGTFLTHSPNVGFDRPFLSFRRCRLSLKR